MSDGAAAGAAREMTYPSVRALTEQLAAPLSGEDQAVQSMPDASPAKWHRAHTTWFFETFVLAPHTGGYRHHHDGYDYLFNSYYDAVGDRHPRHQRGLLSRPSAEEVGDYRLHVDAAMEPLLDDPKVSGLIELGLHHEQQHQELLMMDIKHALAGHPLRPSYCQLPATPAGPTRSLGWLSNEGGVVEIGHESGGSAFDNFSFDNFAFDNESPRHEELVSSFEIADRLVTSGEWMAFIDDGGYQRPELWMSEGWASAGAAAWQAPLYWESAGGAWSTARLGGTGPVAADEPVSHVSWFEADAFARWTGARLPTETEWEISSAAPACGAWLDTELLHPSGATRSMDPGQWHGELWQWTESSYRPYPGFRPAAGAVGEYNGKFMINQQVLRGSSCVTPPGHARRTYRNFFAPSARWMFSGVRLARD